jgi:hypothetical protein
MQGNSATGSRTSPKCLHDQSRASSSSVSSRRSAYAAVGQFQPLITLGKAGMRMPVEAQPDAAPRCKRRDLYLAARAPNRRFLLIRLRHPIVLPMIDPMHRVPAEPKKVTEAVSFPFRLEGGERIRQADDLTALSRAKSLFRAFKVPGTVAVGSLVAIERPVGVAQVTQKLPTRGRGRWGELLKSSMVAAGVTLCLSPLGACNNPADCSGGEYRGGCLAGTQGSPGVSPATVKPVSPAPYSAPPNPGANLGANLGAGTVRRGDPSEFADVDDKQCRSYGLTFGSRDYADCRIRLSAQHRGLDPNIGTASPGSGSR